MAARMAFLDSHSKWGCPFRTTVGANTTILHLFQIATIDLTRTDWSARRMKSRVKPVRRYRNGIRSDVETAPSVRAFVLTLAPRLYL
jgi:hypothetical protein